jgi:tetratricopeptide (TPR) repeat protein
MSRNRSTVVGVVPFPGKAVPKFGYKRVRRRKTERLEDEGQLNLFDAPSSGNSIGFGRHDQSRMVRMPPGVTPFEEALLLDERGEDSAADHYWKAITAGDSVADAYCNLGIIERRRKRVGKAFNCFTNSLEADPRHFEAHYNVANLYFETGDLRLAKLHYEIAAEIQPEYAEVFFNLGLVHALNEDYRAAVAALSNYRELVPELEDAQTDDLLDSLKRSIDHPK